jgi:hypothetical protein
MRGGLPLFMLHTLRTLLLPLVLFFLFLYLNMLSAARIAQYNDYATGRTVHGSNSVTDKRSSAKRLTGCGGWGCFLEGEPQNSHPSSADHKNVWRYTSTPSTFLCGVHVDYEGGDTREQVTGQ